MTNYARARTIAEDASGQMETIGTQGLDARDLYDITLKTQREHIAVELQRKGLGD